MTIIAAMDGDGGVLTELGYTLAYIYIYILEQIIWI